MRLGIPAATLAAAAVIAVAGYGVWSRDRDVVSLQHQAEASAPPRVALVSPKPGPAELTLTLPGQVAAWNEAQIYAQVSGYIGHWFADYGAHVQAGQELATIHTPGLDAQYEAAVAQLKVAQANANISELTANRFDALKGTGYETQQTIDDKDADALAKKAAVASAQENVDHYKAMLSFKHIAAPFDGIITARRVNVGDFIGTDGADDTRGSASGQAPFAIGDVSKLRIFVSVPQSLTGALKPGLKASLHTLVDPAKGIPVRFLTKAGAVRTATRTMTTEFEDDNPEGSGLVPGAYVEVTLTYPGDADLFTVPSQAVLSRPQGAEVALVDDGGRVHLHDVVLGRDLGLDVEVRSGLSARDRLVANPSLGLLDGQIVKTVSPEPGYEPDTSHTSRVSDAGASSTGEPSAAIRPQSSENSVSVANSTQPN